MKIFSLISRLVILTWLLISGCTFNPLSEVENLIADYNFRAALTKLDELAEEGYESEEFHRIRALCLFVEGRNHEGFSELDHPSTDDQRDLDGRILFEAAKVIIREKFRYNEAVTLIDSSLKFNSSLEKDILDLLWRRGLEYLNVPGTGGYHFIKRANEIDEGTTQRLRRHNRIFHKRFAEIDRIYTYLKLLDGRVKLFRNNKGRYPKNLSELQGAGFTSDLKQSGKGWRIELASDGEEGYKLTARALKKNPKNVITGTILNAKDS